MTNPPPPAWSPQPGQPPHSPQSSQPVWPPQAPQPGQPGQPGRPGPSSASSADPMQSGQSDFATRIIVAGAGAVIMLIAGFIALEVSSSWIPMIIIVLLVVVHVILSLSDTYLLEDPKNAPSRAIAGLKNLTGGTATGAGAAPGAAPASGPAPQAFAPPTQTPPQTPPSPQAPHSATPPGPHPAPPQAAPQAPPAPHQGPGVAQSSGSIPLGPGLSFDPPGPDRPSVIHGFGSYGGPKPDTAAPPTPSQPAADIPSTTTNSPAAAAPTDGFAPPRPAADVPDRAANADKADGDHPADASVPSGPPSQFSGTPQWEFDDDDDVDDPDATIQRPPRA